MCAYEKLPRYIRWAYIPAAWAVAAVFVTGATDDRGPEGGSAPAGGVQTWEMLGICSAHAPCGSFTLVVVLLTSAG